LHCVHCMRWTLRSTLCASRCMCRMRCVRCVALAENQALVRADLSQTAALFQLRIRVNLPSAPLPFPSLPALLLPFPSPPLPSPSLPRSDPLNQLGCLGTEGALLIFHSGVWGRAPVAVAFYCIVCSQNASGSSIIFWFFGQHCNDWQNASQSRLRSNLDSPCNLRI